MGNRVPEDLARCLVRSLRNIPRTAAFDGNHQRADISSVHVVNELVSKSRKYIGFQAPQNIIGMAGPT